MEDSKEELTRYLSPLSVWGLSFGCAVGWGAFVMPGTTFLPTAGPMGTTIGLFVGALIMVLLGRNYHFMMQRYRGCGGSFTFVRKTFGNDHAFLNAWFLVLTYVAIVWANVTALALIIRAVFGNVLQFGFHYTLIGYDIYGGEVLLELIVLVLCALVVAYRKKLAGIIQTILAVVLIAGIIVGFVLVVRHITSETTIRPLFQPDGKPIGQIFNIITLAPWAFIGFESVSHSSREFRFSPKRIFTILTIAVATGFFAYTFLNDIAVLAHPSNYQNWQEYIGNLGSLSGRESMPVFNAIYSCVGETGVIILTVTVLAGILTGIIGNTIASSRLLYSMSENGILPKWFRKRAADTTPKNAVLFIALVSAIMPFFGRTAIGWIVDVTSIGAVIAYGYTSAAAFACAKREKNRHVMITGGVGVFLAVLFAIFLMVPNLVSAGSLAPESYLILALWSILGFIFFRHVFRKDKERRFGRSTVVWIALLFVIFFTSLMWMRQQTQTQITETMEEINEHYGSEADDTFVEDEADSIEDTLTFNSIIQMVLIVISLVIMISVYMLIMRRSREDEIERIKAEENSRAKSIFLSNMSHDIRTPMNAIIGYLNLARREDITLDELKEYMEKIEGSSQHLLALINDVLEMSRIESGKMELEEIDTDLSRVMHDVRDMFRNQMDEKHIRYTVKTTEMHHPFVCCDRNRLNRVLLNLISNAFKFTPEGGEVSVRLRELKEETTSDVQEADGTESPGDVLYGTYEIRVKDSGIGMTPEFAARVFEAFERERTSTVSGIQGTGLGMAITKSIVDVMGGSIRVETAPGKGTEFIVLLPMRKQETAVEEKGESADSSANQEAADFSGKRALLVDDMDINREIAVMMLEQMGMKTDTAVNGAEAVQKVSGAGDGDYDVVLMDIQMPVMDGYSATKAIRELRDPRRRTVPIIAMTANAFSEDVKKSIEAGMNAHVAKPIDVNTLISALNEVLTPSATDKTAFDEDKQ